jgi:replication factor C subunit 3/5
MTKNAQQALKYLLQSSSQNVRFCLICNYISKIDESLKNEFICIRFNQLPRQDIYKFIKNITINENLDLSEAVIETILSNYNSDIRSMINFIQLNQNVTNWEANIISSEIWERIFELLKEKKENTIEIIEYIHQISIQYNTDKPNILKKFFNYMIRNKKENINKDVLNIMDTIMHCIESKLEHSLLYFCIHMKAKLNTQG